MGKLGVLLVSMGVKQYLPMQIRALKILFPFGVIFLQRPLLGTKWFGHSQTQTFSFTASDFSLNSFDGSGYKFADFNTLEYAEQWLHFVTINTTGQTGLF